MATIVMTGGTSGFGQVAVGEMTRRGRHHVVLGARNGLPTGSATNPDVQVHRLDLAVLDSVRSFADDVRARTDRIDALVLNAGVYRPDVRARTVDGFETTFAVNHLGNHLLLRLLMDRLAEGARVVLTTSGTHNPAERSGFPPPRHADTRLLAHPERDADLDRSPRRAGRRAYTSSKLCAVLTAQALAVHPDAVARRVTAIAYCPGQAPGTGLTRDEMLPLRAMWWLMGTAALRAPMRRLVPQFTSRAEAGRLLADLALGTVRPPTGHVHVALRHGRPTFPAPSDLASRSDVAAGLWEDSAHLLGLPTSAGPARPPDSTPTMQPAEPGQDLPAPKSTASVEIVPAVRPGAVW